MRCRTRPSPPPREARLRRSRKRKKHICSIFLSALSSLVYPSLLSSHILSSPPLLSSPLLSSFIFSPLLFIYLHSSRFHTWLAQLPTHYRYTKKTQLEHILLRPDTYIGSVEKQQQNLWVLDSASGLIVQKQINIVPGLFKVDPDSVFASMIGRLFVHSPITVFHYAPIRLFSSCHFHRLAHSYTFRLLAFSPFIHLSPFHQSSTRFYHLYAYSITTN